MYKYKTLLGSKLRVRQATLPPARHTPNNMTASSTWFEATMRTVSSVLKPFLRNHEATCCIWKSSSVYSTVFPVDTSVCEEDKAIEIEISAKEICIPEMCSHHTWQGLLLLSLPNIVQLAGSGIQIHQQFLHRSAHLYRDPLWSC